MPNIVSPEFDGDAKKIEQFIEGLKAVTEIACDCEFVSRLELLLRWPDGRKSPEAWRISGGFSSPLDTDSYLPHRQSPEQYNSPKHVDTRNSFEDQIDRIEALLESAASDKRFYTPKELAKLEQVRPATVRKWIKDGRLHAVSDPHRMAGPRHRYVILAEDYEKFRRGGH